MSSLATRAPAVALWLATLVALAAGAGTARADQPDLRQRAWALCAAFDRPLAPADVAALGPGADGALLALYGDAGERPFVRARALIALGYTRTERAREALAAAIRENAAAARGPAVLYLERGLLGYAAAAGPAAETLLAPFLDHGVPDVRAAAARALALSGAPGALAALRAHRDREPVAFVRAVEERAAGQLAPRP